VAAVPPGDFAGLAELGRSGRQRPGVEEMTALHAWHDQYMIDV
jgi:hypothetical protein